MAANINKEEDAYRRGGTNGVMMALSIVRRMRKENKTVKEIQAALEQEVIKQEKYADSKRKR